MPVDPRTPARPTASARPGTRLTWWTPVLPALVFTALLLLLTLGTGDANAASEGGTLGRITGRVLTVLG
ncbi:hypothetical protein ACN20G_21535 [Streptomyces sp. BI20]|uniref:hypothetical protein n=1 Tax=Streptomyces sp. BI20 TaxID=3403460 RepID=UPI003C77C0E8